MEFNFINKLTYFRNSIRTHVVGTIYDDSVVSAGNEAAELLMPKVNRGSHPFVKELFYVMVDLLQDIDSINKGDPAPDIIQNTAEFLELADSLIEEETNVAYYIEQTGLRSMPERPLLRFGSRKTRKSPKKKRKSTKRSRKPKKSVKRSSKSRKTAKK